MMECVTIDMTLPAYADKYVEVHTEAGVIRITNRLVTTRSGLPRVVVDVEANTQARERTPQGGHWIIETTNFAISERSEIRLTKDG